MPAVPFKKTRLTQLQLASRYQLETQAILQYFDAGQVTLGAGSNVGANTTVEFSVTGIALGKASDVISVSPQAAMPAGLAIVGAYISTASVGTGNPAQTYSKATMKIRFANLTGATIDAAGTYSWFQVGR